MHIINPPPWHSYRLHQRKSTYYTASGKQWTDRTQLENLDVADDLARLSDSAEKMHGKPYKLSELAEGARLHLSFEKSNTMRTAMVGDDLILLVGNSVEDVGHFRYQESCRQI